MHDGTLADNAIAISLASDAVADVEVIPIKEVEWIEALYGLDDLSARENTGPAKDFRLQ